VIAAQQRVLQHIRDKSGHQDLTPSHPLMTHLGTGSHGNFRAPQQNATVHADPLVIWGISDSKNAAFVTGVSAIKVRRKKSKPQISALCARATGDVHG
jgi:hypothetical protein